jgi:hypothetical protein
VTVLTDSDDSGRKPSLHSRQRFTSRELNEVHLLQDHFPSGMFSIPAFSKAVAGVIDDGGLEELDAGGSEGIDAEGETGAMVPEIFEAHSLSCAESC